MAFYDVIIKNGAVFDGKANYPQKVDIGISGDKIKKIGNLQNDAADKIIDAENKYVCPGFIDLTNHSDTHWTLFNYPSQESLIRQGITTILGGNCGLSLTPLIKGISISKININWQTTGELLSVLENRGLAVNFATLVGFNTLEKEILGGEMRKTTDSEFKQMKLLLKSSLEQGAFGISTSFGKVHKESLSDDELIELFEIIKKKNGLIKHHLEDEGKNILPAISRLLNISRKTKTKIHISHFKVLGKGSWGFFNDALRMMNNARQEKINLSCDFFPYERTGSDLFMLLPSWFREMGENEIKEILRTEENKHRKEVIDYLKSLTLHYDKIITASSTAAETDNLGKTISQISRLSNLTPEEVILNLLLINNMHVSIFNETINMEHILSLAKEEYAAISSDGLGYDISEIKSLDLPHPRSFGAFPRAFRLFVKENKILNWETAIYKMSGLPAKILGLENRGIIAKGKKADIIIFNPEEISDYSTYDDPFQFSKGIEYSFINGIMVLDNGQLKNKFAGQILRKK
jgi:N-acyl-D-amino-acid deacylase